MTTNHLLDHKSYDRLPTLIVEAMSIGTDTKDKDLLLFSIIATLSGCLDNYGYYRGEKTFPTLFFVVLAPPGTGKGIMKYAKRIATSFHDYKVSTTDGKSRILIPGNSSSAAIYSELERNKGAGLIFESEVDTLTNALNQDYGGFHDVLRNCFQHETISISRKGKDGPYYTVINSPRFALILSGTEKQLYPLIDSVENGLFSRFAFMILKPELIWKDVSPKGQNASDAEVNSLINNFLQALIFNEKYPFELLLSKEQWDHLNEHFGNMLVTEAEKDLELDATIKRLALMAFRIMIILTSLRRYEEDKRDEKSNCADTDFAVALELSNSLFNYALKVYGLLKKKVVPLERRPTLRFLEKLPYQFTTAEAITIGDQINLRERTVGKYLSELNGKYLLQDKKGYYRKMTSADD